MIEIEKEKKLITIIICTYNREELLRNILCSLKNQTSSKDVFKVIVIDNNSKDKTKETFFDFINELDIQYFFEKKQGLSHARNRGVEEADTEYLSFIDDDSIADPNWIKLALEIINKNQPDIFGGPIFPFYNIKKPIWFLDKYETFKDANESRYLKDLEFLYGSNIFFKKAIFTEIGFFDSSLGMNGKKLYFGEEVDVQIRAKRKNSKIYFDSQLIVNHLVAREKLLFGYVIKRFFLSSFSRAQMFDKSRSSFSYLNKIFKDTFFFFYLLLKLPFRNKNEFIYWQNYFIEVLLPRLDFYGRLYYKLKK